MKIKLITVGNLKKGPLTDLASMYIERLARYTKFEMIAVKSNEDILKKVTNDDYIIACDERGKEMQSQEFASFIEESQIRSVKSIAFIVGGADGISASLRSKADLVLSFSSFTLQHDLAVIIFLEQLYRAHTIIKGEPYHR